MFFFITAKFVLWWLRAWMQYVVIPPTSPSSLISLTPSSILPPPHKSFSYTHVFLFCFCDPLLLTRDIYVNLCLELFSGAWWARMKESNNFPTSRSHYVQVREGWGLWYPPLSVINSSQVILCRQGPRQTTTAAVRSLLQWLYHAQKMVFCSLPFLSFYFFCLSAPWALEALI